MGLFEMVFYLAMAGIVADVAVKLIRGHPAKQKEIKQLRDRVEEMDAKLTATMNELAETREMLDDEITLRAELAERLDFTERLLTRGTPPAPDPQEEIR
ncbi:MAG: hypothetical protein AB7R55_06730 [Gemmatimonadales bacterium]